MRGYLCDGGCGTFRRGAPAATYEHHALVVNPDEEGRANPKRITLNGELCEDCAIRVSQQLALYDWHEVLAAASGGDDD